VLPTPHTFNFSFRTRLSLFEVLGGTLTVLDTPERRSTFLDIMSADSADTCRFAAHSYAGGEGVRGLLHRGPPPCQGHNPSYGVTFYGGFDKKVKKIG
jgi:hypothetical protein